MSTDRTAPMRAVRLTLRLDADDMRELSSALHTIAEQAERGELTVGCSGGPSSGYIYELLTNPEQTHERYFEQLREYLAERRSAAPTEPKT